MVWRGLVLLGGPTNLVTAMRDATITRLYMIRGPHPNNAEMPEGRLIKGVVSGNISHQITPSLEPAFLILPFLSACFDIKGLK